QCAPLRPRVLLFFVYGHLDVQTLHSFPTRRSSDLKRGMRSLIGGGSAAESHFSPCRILDRAARRHGATGWDRALRGAEQLGPELDRKSTRLNSSHVASPYAVFCLRKKKERQRTVER